MLALSCTNKSYENTIRDIVSEYYNTYQERTDFEKFLSFYSEEIILEDIINADKIAGKKELSNFFGWNRPGFHKLESNALVIHEQIIEGNTAVTKGHFTPFTWHEVDFEAMHFTTLLTFDEAGKIIKQVDWINYPSSLVDYSTRKNSNEWIGE